MTTTCEVHIFTKNSKKAKEVVTDILKSSKELEKKYNFYNPNSFLSQINQRKIDKLDIETKNLLNLSKQFYKKTDKIFDVTMGTLKISRESNTIDEFRKKTEELTPFVGIEHFKIKRDKTVFDNPYTKIDFGGLVKEYAVDKAIKILKRAKIESALVNFGGDIYALGTKANGEAFSIGIKNPLNPKEFITYIKLKNQALTTSASYERNYKIEDKVLSHIISKEESLQQEIISATVISTSAVQSGVYSTALMIKPTLDISAKKILVDKSLNLIY